MALARHLQHAKIENDTSRHSGQFRWLQSRHFALRKGQSSRLAIDWSYYRRSHYYYDLWYQGGRCEVYSAAWSTVFVPLFSSAELPFHRVPILVAESLLTSLL
jgi:hypothetical protein